MAAQRHFHCRREPPQTPGVVLPQDECRLRQVHLSCDGRHDLVRQRFLQDAHRCWIPCKYPIGKRINDVVFHTFSVRLLTSSRKMRSALKTSVALSSICHENVSIVASDTGDKDCDAGSSCWSART